MVDFEAGEEERGWPIWRPLGGVVAAITALIVLLLVLSQCGGSSARANPLCSPDAVPEETVDALREAATATQRAMEESDSVPKPRAIGGPSATPPATVTVASQTAPAPTPVGTSPPGVPASPETPAATAPPQTPTPAVSEGGADLESALNAADGSQAPFFAQNDPQWGAEEYDHSISAPNGCPGPNLANCGCALTSVTNVMAADGVEVMPDGEPVNPSSVNAWASADAQRLSDGSIVSRGFAPGGNVNWNMAMAISGGARAQAPEQPVVSLAFVGGAGTQQVTDDLAAGRPVILSTPRQSHWFTAEGLASDGAWLFWDPFYLDQVRKGSDFGPTSIHYESDRPEAGVIRRSVVISTRADSLRVKDKSGKELDVIERVSWEDPTCEHDGAPDYNLNQVYVPDDAGDVTIEVEDEDPTAIVIHDYGSDGSVKITVHEADGDQTRDYGSEGGGNPTPAPETATPSVTATPEVTPTPGGPSPTTAPPQPPTQPPPTAAPNPSPTATPDLPGPPANIAVSASPTSIPCNGTAFSTITANVTDARGRPVANGTDVRFLVLPPHTLNPASIATVDGRAPTRFTPASYAPVGINVTVRAGNVEQSIRINCLDTEPPVTGTVVGIPQDLYETDGVTCTPPLWANVSQLRVTISDVSAVTASASYSVGAAPLVNVALTRETPGGNIYVANIGPFGLGTLPGSGSPDDWLWISIQVNAQDANGNSSAPRNANTAVRVFDCFIIL